MANSGTKGVWKMGSDDRASGRWQVLRTPIGWFLTFLGIVCVSLAWASSSPSGASPDEPAHIKYAWGVSTGQTLPWVAQEKWLADSPAQITIEMPSALEDHPDVRCYAFKTDEPSCANDYQGVDDSLITTSSYMTRYPPVYYGIVGLAMRALLALGVSGEVTLLTARVLSGVVSGLVVLGAARLLSKRFGIGAASVAVAAVMTPQFLFISGSINPNGFEISAAFATAVGVASLVHDGSRSRRTPILDQAFLVLSTFFLAFARPASMVWLGILIVALVLLRSGRRALLQTHWATRLWLTLSVAGGLAWFVYLNALRDGGVTDHDLSEWNATSPSVRALLVILKFGDLVKNGYGLLGWGDTPLPILFLVVWLVALAWTVSRSVSLSSGTPDLSLRYASLVFLLCGLAVFAQSYLAGFGWQGRYFLPCMAAYCALMAPSMNVVPSGFLQQRKASISFVAITALLAFAALAWNLGRYLYGYSDVYTRFEVVPVPTTGGAWNPLIGRFTPLVLGFAGAIFLILAFMLAMKENGKVLSARTSLSS